MTYAIEHHLWLVIVLGLAVVGAVVGVFELVWRWREERGYSRRKRD